MNAKLMGYTGLLCPVVLRAVESSICVKNEFFKKFAIRLTSLLAILILGFCIGVGSAWSADGMDPDAEKIMKSMSTYLGGLATFSVNADIGMEIIDLSGQKLRFGSSAYIVAERPGKLYVHRQGALTDLELILSPKALTLMGKNHNAYKQIQGPLTIDSAIDALHKLGLEMPGADLMLSDAYKTISEGVVSSTYIGTDYVNGVKCHNLAFRENRTDWQLWVQVGDVPLPIQYIITTKWLTGAPQYSVLFRNWNTTPQIKAGQFEFSVPKDALSLEEIEVNEMGELSVREVQ